MNRKPSALVHHSSSLSSFNMDSKLPTSPYGTSGAKPHNKTLCNPAILKPHQIQKLKTFNRKRGFNNMIVKGKPEYIDSNKPSTVTKSGIRVISAMSTPRILWFVALRHRVGLLALSTMGLSGFIVYDKVIKLFI